MTIKIILNGQDQEINKNITISNLIKQFELDPEKVAIEKNLEIIDPSSYEESIIENNDKIEIVHFIGGG